MFRYYEDSNMHNTAVLTFATTEVANDSILAQMLIK